MTRVPIVGEVTEFLEQNRGQIASLKFFDKYFGFTGRYKARGGEEPRWPLDLFQGGYHEYLLVGDCKGRVYRYDLF